MGDKVGKGHRVFLLLTAFNFQGAVLFVKRIPPQVHHASSSGGYSRKEGQRPNTNSGDTSWRQTRWDHLTSLFPQTNTEKKREVMVQSFCCAVWWTTSVSTTSSLCTLKAILLWWCWKNEHTAAEEPMAGLEVFITVRSFCESMHKHVPLPLKPFPVHGRWRLTGESDVKMGWDNLIGFTFPWYAQCTCLSVYVRAWWVAL